MGDVVRIEREDEKIKKAEVVNFPNVKLKKDGTPKGTINNTKVNRDNVQPFKEDDIPKMVKYLRDYRDVSENTEDYQIRFRNLVMFVCGINIALRVSDLISLKWSDVFDENWEFLEGKKITPKKTARKKKHVLLIYNYSFRSAISDYKDYIKPSTLDSYIFSSRQNPKGHIGEGSVSEFITKAANVLGIKYNVNTHSMRKTFARVRYDHSEDKTKTLVELMRMFNHASALITLGYICIQEEELKDLYNAVELGYDAIFD